VFCVAWQVGKNVALHESNSDSVNRYVVESTVDPVATAGHYRGADKSLAQSGRKQATATEDFGVHISYLLS
jgi:hypothetical protein